MSANAELLFNATLDQEWASFIETYHSQTDVETFDLLDWIWQRNGRDLREAPQEIIDQMAALASLALAEVVSRAVARRKETTL